MFVVIGRDEGSAVPSLALGPFETTDHAEEWKEFLSARVTGECYVLKLMVVPWDDGTTDDTDTTGE
jgi:hypothetical protein